MLNSNLRTVPSHKGDNIHTSYIEYFKSGLLHPFRAMRYLLRKIIWKLANISEMIPVKSFLGETPIYVIDIGAAGGIHRRWERFGSNLKIFLFEPEKHAFDKLVDAHGSDKRMKVFDCALSENGQEITVHLTKWPRSSSVYPTSKEYVEASHIRDHYEVVELVNLNSKRLADVYVDPDLDLIKIDTEGYELPILKGGNNLLDSCIGLEIEVYFQQVRIGQHYFADVDSYCRSKGFTFIDFEGVGKEDDYSHFLLPSSRLESRGFISAASAAIYFRWPKHIIGLIEDGKWNSNKIYKAVAIYLAYDQAEFAYVLLSLAEEKSIVKSTDLAFLAAMTIIEDYTGFNKSYIYSKIRRM